ncbi:MAG: hypothetical protein RLZ90_57 [Pseudomonadota bacterium]
MVFKLVFEYHNGIESHRATDEYTHAGLNSTK